MSTLSTKIEKISNLQLQVLYSGCARHRMFVQACFKMIETYSKGGVNGHLAILRYRYEGNNTEVVAKKFSITTERVRQLEKKFLEEVRQMLTAMNINVEDVEK